ncbi:hypothetical protein CEXT_219021 [Caerostris extrusa]|uniref:Uncharacterized protein n=1 Tax=Caerostris extrusa TaxID=172846 RepID=A0AAV4WVW0_CAEEX|nr:hypothetical protein CEXT_219021 [Caerostris extrusa]
MISRYRDGGIVSGFVHLEMEVFISKSKELLPPSFPLRRKLFPNPGKSLTKLISGKLDPAPPTEEPSELEILSTVLFKASSCFRPAYQVRSEGRWLISFERITYTVVVVLVVGGGSSRVNGRFLVPRSYGPLSCGGSFSKQTGEFSMELLRGGKSRWNVLLLKFRTFWNVRGMLEKCRS